MSVYTLHEGSAPLLISLPHDGSQIPPGIQARMTDRARRSPDTDWHVGLLYDFARELGASILKPRYSRYVVDLNRPSDGHALYPGRRETGLVPTVMFDAAPIYRDGEEPDADEVTTRIETWWQPYHRALAGELKRLHDRHGHVVLWEGHSIRGEVPMLFDGHLPDFNLGTADCTSCRAELRAQLAEVLAGQDTYTHVLDGRFKGGHITRHYGAPAQGIDAVQLELVQRNYMDEDSFEYLPERAAGVQEILRSLLRTCLAIA